MKRSVFHKLIIIFCVVISMLLIATACDNTSGNKNDDTTTGADISTAETTADATSQTTVSENTTEETETTAANTNATYTVTVVDADGAPLAGATVQLCVGDLCRLPVATDANGIATIEAEAGEYTVKVTLSGYTGEAQYSFPEGSTELTVTLTAES